MCGSRAVHHGYQILLMVSTVVQKYNRQNHRKVSVTSTLILTYRAIVSLCLAATNTIMTTVVTTSGCIYEINA